MYRHILILTILFSQISCRQDYGPEDFVRIRYIGPSDEQIKIVVISVSPQKKIYDWEKNYVLSSETFRDTEAFIKKYAKDLVEEEDNNENDWVAFRISMEISRKSTTFELTTKNASLKFLKLLKAELEVNKNEEQVLDLINQLGIIIDQIS